MVSLHEPSRDSIPELAVWMYFGTQDMPTGNFVVVDLGNLRCLNDYRDVLMMFQYSNCFGVELVMNNVNHECQLASKRTHAMIECFLLAMHVGDHFGRELTESGALATALGGMSLLARLHHRGVQL